MFSVSSLVVGRTCTFWKRRSSAPSFSMDLAYSAVVVAPTHCTSPLANAGLRMFAASNDPEALPAPMSVCISSTKRITSGCSRSSVITCFIRSSNWPRYVVPATIEATSSVTIRLPFSAPASSPTMRSAKPSTIADLPTPGSPIRIGLFFFLRLRICTTRSISFSRPTTGSNLPSSACLVRSRPYLSSAAVLLLLPFC